MDTIASHCKQEGKVKSYRMSLLLLEKVILPGNKRTGKGRRIIDWKLHRKGCRLVSAADSLAVGWQR